MVQHPENVYVYDLAGAQNYSVFAAYPDSEKRPTNAFVWGSSYIHTPAYHDQLEKNGLDSLMTQDLLAENVYFITAASNVYADQLYQMMYYEYGPIYMEIVDVIIDEFIVYKITEVSE